jgi:hypothetical protein
MIEDRRIVDRGNQKKTVEEVAKEIMGIVRNPDTINEFQIKIAVERLTAYAEERVKEALEIAPALSDVYKQEQQRARAEALEEAAKLAEIATIDRHSLTTGAITKVIATAIRALKEKP